MAFKSWVTTFPSVIEYRAWLVRKDVRVLNVVVFNDELVVTYSLF